MRKKYFNVAGEEYSISCVAYEPEVQADNVIIALHGFGGDKESSAVLRLAEMACERGAAVVAFDFPSHGKSEADEHFFTVENCINDGCNIYAFVENEYFYEGNAKGKIHFFATSFGAYVLAQMLKKPYFKGVKAVFRSPAVRMDKTFVEIIANSTIAELANGKMIQCGFERKLTLGNDFYLDLRDHSLDKVYFDNEVLMIFGDRDDVVQPEDMEAFACDRSNITVKVIRGADHRYKAPGHLDGAIFASVSFLLG